MLAGVVIALLGNERAGEVQAHITGIRIGGDETIQRRHGCRRGFPRQQLRFEQGGLLPVRTQLRA